VEGLDRLVVDISKKIAPICLIFQETSALCADHSLLLRHDLSRKVYTQNEKARAKRTATSRLHGYVGCGIAAVIGALWTAFVYFHPASGEKPSPPQKQIEADCGSVAIGGDVSGATVTAANSGDCPKPGR
jgi:hypothetical protein